MLGPQSALDSARVMPGEPTNDADRGYPQGAKVQMKTQSDLARVSKVAYAFQCPRGV